MKKYVFILTIILFGVSIINANADSCSNEEKARLKKEAAKVKMVYEEAEKVVDRRPIPDLGDELYDVKANYFILNISNITNDLTVVIQNNYNNDKISVDYSNTDSGLYSFDWNNIKSIVSFTYKVYGSPSSSCFDELLASGYLITPKYNRLHDTTLCEGVTDFKACDKYITDDTDQEVLRKRILEYKEKKEKTQEQKKSTIEKVIGVIKEHKILTICLASVVLISGVALVIRKRKKRAY